MFKSKIETWSSKSNSRAPCYVHFHIFYRYALIMKLSTVSHHSYINLYIWHSIWHQRVMLEYTQWCNTMAEGKANYVIKWIRIVVSLLINTCLWLTSIFDPIVILNSLYIFDKLLNSTFTLKKLTVRAEENNRKLTKHEHFYTLMFITNCNIQL